MISAYQVIIRLFIYALLVGISTLNSSAQPRNTNHELGNVFSKAGEISSVRSLLIQQKREFVGEQYYNGRRANQPYNIKSASKSIITLLIGIAVDKGFIESIEEPIVDYFPEYFAQNPNSAKEQLTIRHLLSMQAGLESTSIFNYGKWAISKDWAKYQLDQPFVEEPGGKMVYSTGISHLLSIILTKATGTNTKTFAETYLFDPLDIRIGGWDRGPKGYYMGGNNLSMKPSDLLKIGQLILDVGEFEGKQIVSKEWIWDSFQTYTYSNYNPYGYGYMWWNQEVAGYKVFFAWGFGGQYLFMIPELEAAVVLTSSSDNPSQNRSYKRPIFHLLEHSIIPLLKRNY